ncbi:MAG: glycosyltransferase family 2 protein [Candidatus Pacebacteria bacterium]|nr:glycosyltransferase family 2 protein [Candidatus Paceibacterota bacterium]MCF7856959.1 glycosyltransferase family 2 protein [Candidatus Paceibacterota bacterium]
MHRLSIIIPAYNEESTIQKILEKIHAVDLEAMGVSKEIIIVNDGSIDQTIEQVETFIAHNPTLPITLLSQKNQGKGSAIRTAIAHCTGTIIIIQDADLEYDPEDFKLLIAPILNNTADVVYGSRRLKKENAQYSGFWFYVGGMVLTIQTNLLYNTRITDEPTCYKVFRANLLKSIPLACTGFEFCPEITAKIAKRKIPIHEVPISYYPRSVADGKKINWRDGIEGVWTLIKYRFTD